MEVTFIAGLLYETAYAMRIKSKYPIYTFIVTPLDVVKIRLQAQQTPFHQGKTTFILCGFSSHLVNETLFVFNSCLWMPCYHDALLTPLHLSFVRVALSSRCFFFFFCPLNLFCLLLCFTAPWGGVVRPSKCEYLTHCCCMLKQIKIQHNFLYLGTCSTNKQLFQMDTK